MESLIIIVFFVLAVGVAIEAVSASVRARRKHHMDFHEGP